MGNKYKLDCVLRLMDFIINCNIQLLVFHLSLLLRMK